MTPPQITYTPKTTMTMEKKQHLKLYECCICHQKWSCSISTLVYWRVINFTWIKFQQKTCNLDQQIQLFEESFKNDMFLWFRHQPQGSLSVFHLFLPVTHKVSCLNYLQLLQGNNPFVVFTNSPNLRKPLRSTRPVTCMDVKRKSGHEFRQPLVKAMANCGCARVALETTGAPGGFWCLKDGGRPFGVEEN